VVILRSWHAAVFAAVVAIAVAGGICSASVRAANEAPAIGQIERSLASALGKAERNELLRFQRHRTKSPEAPVYQVVWVNFVTGQRRVLAYNASGHLTSDTSSAPKTAPPAGGNLDGACGCDLDPFTNFPGRTLHVSLLVDQTIDGHPTFHLRFTVTGAPEPSTTDFWVDRSTYLPVRSKVVYRIARGNGQLGPTMSTTDEFTWLPRTRANLAQLAGRSSVVAVQPVGLGSCTTEVGVEPRLAGVPRAMVNVAFLPYGVVATGGWIFVSGYVFGPSGGEGGYVAVMSNQGFAPTLVRVVNLPVSQAAGSSLTPDGQYLLVAASTGALVLSVSELEEGAPDPVLGVLNGAGGVEVIPSQDGRFVFVSTETKVIEVFDLQQALATGFASSGFVGTIPVDPGVLGMALSPNGRTLYATSLSGRYAAPLANTYGTLSPHTYGTLSVIDVAKAETQPQGAVVSTAAAGCQARRVAVSPDGNTVWATTSASNQLLAFSSQKLVSDPTHALLAAVRVGATPVGVTTFDNGKRLAVADAKGADVTIVDAQAALHHKPSLIGQIPTGARPRELTVAPNGTTLLAASVVSSVAPGVSSGQLEVVDLQNLG
jgi:DNA-binding beta-propeller fold protein YncE